MLKEYAKYRNDWQNEVENALRIFHYDVLERKGKISHKQVREKSKSEYEKFKVIQEIKQIENK